VATLIEPKLERDQSRKQPKPTNKVMVFCFYPVRSFSSNKQGPSSSLSCYYSFHPKATKLSTVVRFCVPYIGTHASRELRGKKIDFSGPTLFT